MIRATFLSQPNDIFSPEVPTSLPETFTPNLPINGYRGYLCPGRDAAACEKGRRCAAEVIRSKIADFERSLVYCDKNGESNPDRMVHVSTFEIIHGNIYMTYYANTHTSAEDHREQEARLAFCPVDNPDDLTVLTVQKVGDKLDGKTIDCVYDTIFLYKGGDELYLLWTASADGMYYRFWRTFHMSTNTFGPIYPNRFKVGNVTNDFSMRGIVDALRANGLPHKTMFADIGIMQKLSTREENGETYYYTGAYSGHFNCLIKSRDFITWEYVSTPDFDNQSQWENAVYVMDDRCYYFVRQFDCENGFLTYYDLKSGTWATPCLIRDAQSRSDFFVYRSELYLVHAPLNRDGFGIVKIDRNDLSQSRPVLVADLGSSCFYPFSRVIGDELFLSYTVDRKHIRLSKFCLDRYLTDKGDV